MEGVFKSWWFENALFACHAMGEIDSKYIEEAMDYKKKKGKSVWLNLGIAAACLCFVLITARVIIPVYRDQYSRNKNTEAADTVKAPLITIMGKNYLAPDMPVDELPAEYHYLRDLTAEEANRTGLAGSRIYVDPQDEDMSVIYLYQECGTPVSENTVDNTKRQWAYVKWTVLEEED